MGSFPGTPLGQAPPATTLREYLFSQTIERAMDGTTLGWIAVILLIIAGLAGTVLPALPGTILVLGGIVLGAWLDDFTRVKWWVVTIKTSA